MQGPEGHRSPYALEAGKGWIYRSGIDFTVKVGEIQGGSGVAVVEYATKRGEEPSDHTHATEDEMFYVLEGAITFRCGKQSFDLRKGGFVFLPHGVEHGYTIMTDDPVRLLVVTSPVRDAQTGGWGGFISDMESQGELIAKPHISRQASVSGTGETNGQHEDP